MDNKYLKELAKTYPNRDSAKSEIINLSAILSLPKGTEHFMSDLHGEHEAYLHIRRNASGVIRRKVDLVFGDTLTDEERAELATLIYYPEEKLDALKIKGGNLDGWYKTTLIRLLEITRLVSCKYTRSKVRKHLSRTSLGYEYIINELLNNDYDEEAKDKYYDNILNTIITTGSAEQVILALAATIKSLVIDHLHIVGDVFDRGPRADIIVDELMRESSIDIQWGNHDILWMGAAMGSRTCISAVINNSITYKNLDVIEIGYGISLRPLSLFATEVYGDKDVSGFMPKGSSGGDMMTSDDDTLIARMHKAIAVIQLKLEGQVIMRNPEFNMADRLLLDKIDFERGTVTLDGVEYPLKDCDFPTVDKEHPFELTEREAEVMHYLKFAFMRSEKLSRHLSFLMEKGGIYTVYNENLLFHGCLPLNEDGTPMSLPAAANKSGKALFDYCDKRVRQTYFAKEGTPSRKLGKDFLWFLWCGKNSPLCGREKIASFERLFLSDESTWEEKKNPYYSHVVNKSTVESILSLFSLSSPHSHIINGHVPVKRIMGESPVKAEGKLVVIDGGFCRAYQNTTGIAGYTLIYNAEGMRLASHESFKGREFAIKNNEDIVSDVVIFEHSEKKILVRDTDVGRQMLDKIKDLNLLLREYELGNIKEIINN